MNPTHGLSILYITQNTELRCSGCCVSMMLTIQLNSVHPEFRNKLVRGYL